MNTYWLLGSLPAVVAVVTVLTLAVLLGGCLHDLLDEGAGATTQDREQEHRRQDRQAADLQPRGSMVAGAETTVRIADEA